MVVQGEVTVTDSLANVGMKQVLGPELRFPK